MRTFKTSKKNRTNYNYYTATGEKIELTPADVGSTWIAMLHEDDDAAVDAERREQYHVPIRYDSLTNSEGDSGGLDEKLDFLADPTLDPLERMVDSITQQEHQNMLDKLRDAVEALQPQQKDLVYKVFFEGRTCTSIAAEDGVSKAAISNRLKKIYAVLRKKLTT